MNCSNCNHPAELHDGKMGCRVASTFRPPNQDMYVFVCGCRKAPASAAANAGAAASSGSLTMPIASTATIGGRL